MAIEYFCCYHSYLEAMEQLNDAEKGRLFTACLQYSMTGEAQQLSGNERFVFPAFRSQIDRDNQKYEETCKKRAESARKRWDANACNGMQANANHAKEKEKEKEKAKEKAKDKEKENISPPISPSRAPRFSPPSLDEVKAYCRERRNTVDAEKWYDYYTANGWKVGKNPMKDWKAAVRTWEGRDRKSGHRDSGFDTSNPFLEMLEERRGHG